MACAIPAVLADTHLAVVVLAAGELRDVGPQLLIDVLVVADLMDNLTRHIPA
ncbi:hypothetical protein [Streptomyces sp. NPDC054838]